MVARLLREFAQFLLRQCRHNQQDRVRAIRSSLKNLKLINDEILAQARKSGYIRRNAQVLKRALEEFFVSQHGKSGGTALFQFPRQLSGIKLAANQASRWRSLL